MHSLDSSAVRAKAGVVSLALRRFAESWDGLLSRLPLAAYACDADGRIVGYNTRAAELWGREPAIGDDSELFCGSYKLIFDGRLIERDETPMAHVLATGEPVHGAQGVVERPDGSRIWAMVHIDPITDASGVILGAINCFHDITELKQAQSELTATEAQHREILEALPVAVYTTDAEGRVTFYNQAAAALAGREPRLGEDKWCVTWKLYTPDGAPLAHEDCPMARALKEGVAIRGVEALAERPDGVRVPFMPYPTPLKNAAGEVVGAVNMLVDISDRKGADESQKALIDELNHRVKNTLATVQSIAVQTARRAASLETFLPAFESRIMALSKAHDVLTRGKWEGASLHDILSPELTSFAADDPDRVTLEGPLLKLRPKAAVALALVFHELTTNAARYGALSSAEGKLHVGWRLDRSGAPEDHALIVDWIESGGPMVKPPSQLGFGARLVERTVVSDLGGASVLDFDMDGVRCDIRVPLSRALR